MTRTPTKPELLSFVAVIAYGCSGSVDPAEVGTPLVYIQEVMASNQSTLADEDGDYSDWIEIRNPTDAPINLHGFGLSDSSNDPFSWVFPSIVLGPEEELILFASAKDRSVPSNELHTNFRLDAGADEVVVTSRSGSIVDRVELPDIPSDLSLGRHPFSPELWQIFHRPTPGQRNREDGWTNPFDGGIQRPDSGVYISEVLTRNRTSILDENGDSSDWIELHNVGNRPIDLTAYTLSDDVDRLQKWRFPQFVLEPGEYGLVFASGKNRRVRNQELHTSFQLSEEETLVLSDPLGEVVDLIQIGTAFADRSIGRAEAGSQSWLYYASPTPGAENDTEGFTDLSVAPWRPAEGLRITEAQGNNRSTLRDEFRQYSDWVEIQNISGETIEMEGIGLTDDVNDPYRWSFPPHSLAPDEYVLVHLSGIDCSETRCERLHAPFRLTNLGETLQLTSSTGRVMDRFSPGRTSVDMSSGRHVDEADVRVYFDEPTPGRPNTTNYFLGFVRDPVVQLIEGDTPDILQVHIESPTTGSVVRYTLDGSEPNRYSERYTEPLTVTRSGPIRVRAWRDDLMPSEIVTRTVLFDANHALPIVALSVDPEAMFDPLVGIHALGPDAEDELPYRGANFWNPSEVPIHLEFYEDEDRLGFEMDLGLRIFGAYSRAMPKKSFRIIAREEYGDDTIDYPLFVDRNQSEFDSFVLRTSGQDAISSRFRDVFLTQLTRDAGVDYQGYRTVVLYINGEYWGIYNIREKINPEMLGRTHGVDPDDISLLRANGFAEHGSGRQYAELVAFVEENDLSESENYAYVRSVMDVENFANFWIIQMFISNADNGNIRFWRDDGPDGRWRWILYDLDWAWRYIEPDTVSSATDARGTGAGRAFRTVLLRGLLANDEFRDLFLRLCGEHLRETFDPERSLGLIDTLAMEIESEIAADHERWPDTYSNWPHQVELMRNFARERPDRFRNHIQAYFRLSDTDMIRYGIRNP